MFCRIVVFSVTVYKEERVVVVAEQKPNCSDEEAFTWMNSVVPAVESIHGVNLYAIVLLAPGKLPRVKHNLNRGLLCVCVCCMVMSSSILLFLFLHSVHLELCMFTRPDRDSLMVHCIRSTCSCVPISECVCHVAHANCSALVFLVHRSVNNLPIPKQFPCTDYSHAHLSRLSAFLCSCIELIVLDGWP